MSGTRCSDCGHLDPGVLRLRGVSGALDFRVGVAVGRPLFQRAVGEDSKFVDHHQFTLICDAYQGWLIEGVTARNPTFHNGVKLLPGNAQALAAGDAVTVGSSRARLTVEFLRSGS